MSAYRVLVGKTEACFSQKKFVCLFLFCQTFTFGKLQNTIFPQTTSSRICLFESHLDDACRVCDEAVECFLKVGVDFQNSIANCSMMLVL